MGIARDLAPDGAQAKALGGVIGRVLQTSVIKNKGFRLATFKEQLSVIGPVGGLAQDGERLVSAKGEEEPVTSTASDRTSRPRLSPRSSAKLQVCILQSAVFDG